MLAVSILDRYLANLEKDKITLKSQVLHLLGMTCVYIASKFEDVRAITLDELVEKAGHFKFEGKQVVQMEK